MNTVDIPKRPTKTVIYGSSSLDMMLHEHAVANAAAQALIEIERLRLATDDGTCAKRFDRAWQVATDALAKINASGWKP